MTRLLCRLVPEGEGAPRLGVFTAEDVQAGDIVERCYALSVPAWQANPEFTWACGAFRAAGPAEGGGIPEVTPFSAEAGAALLPLGWGMLYADALRVAASANLAWRCDQQDGKHWVVLSASEHIFAGRELVVTSRGWPAPEDASKQDAVSYAAERLDATALELLNEAQERKELATADIEVAGGGEIMHPCCDVQVAASPLHGVGVFARRCFAKDEVVEVAPCVVVEDNEVPSYSGGFEGFSHGFADYTYEVHPRCKARRRKAMCGLALGCGSIYNHSCDPNVEHRWALGSAHRRIGCHPLALSYAYVALRDIAFGEELLQDYGAEYWESRGGDPSGWPSVASARGALA